MRNLNRNNNLIGIVLLPEYWEAGWVIETVAQYTEEITLYFKEFCINISPNSRVNLQLKKNGYTRFFNGFG